MIVDIIIAVLFVFALFRGRELGLVRQFFSALGFFGGLVIGALIEPHFIRLAHTAESRLFLTLAITLGSAILFLIVGEYVGILIKQHLPQKIADKIDAATGSLAGGASLLAAVWLAAAVLITLPFAGLQTGLKDSYIISKLDAALPPAPSVISELGYLINPNGFPRVFLGSEPVPPKDIVAPDITGQLKLAVEKDSKSVVKIEGLGCGGLVEGSGFVVGQNLVATNAHVVAGIVHPYVSDSNGEHSARAVLFDPNLDFAVLRVNGLAGSPLVISSSHVNPDTKGAIMGYPGGGGFTADGAAVIDSFIATGRNIYNQGQTERRVLEIKAPVVPGNSGGPLITSNGSVIGVVFAKSTTYPNVGYALATGEVQAELRDASAASASVSTGRCAQ